MFRLLAHAPMRPCRDPTNPAKLALWCLQYACINWPHRMLCLSLVSFTGCSLRDPAAIGHTRSARRGPSPVSLRAAARAHRSGQHGIAAPRGGARAREVRWVAPEEGERVGGGRLLRRGGHGVRGPWRMWSGSGFGPLAPASCRRVKPSIRQPPAAVRNCLKDQLSWRRATFLAFDGIHGQSACMHLLGGLGGLPRQVCTQMWAPRRDE